MRRSVRRPRPAPSRRAAERASSPSNSELSVSLVTPSVSPTPEQPKPPVKLTPTRPDGHPKRPMNAFILFSNEMRSVLADDNPHLSNAAVSVLLGQRWREMLTHEKAGYVSAAKRIKEDFHLQHPDAKTRCVSRKAKRAKLDHAGPSNGRARSITPPSLQALALVGSRLNQATLQQYRRSDSASTYTQSSTHGAHGDAPSRRSYDDYEDDEDEDEDETASQWEETMPGDAPAAAQHQPSLLEQLCTVAENEHTAAAKMLSALGAC